ncbi:protein scarlet-like [Schistocerca americana]|uniref:protein scarlet-like n=1 Tax=Schistocerca americana TaxID=7009 RepID=UPI001F4F845A|nr:protein scarlet-like [Schistocerca americana]
MGKPLPSGRRAAFLLDSQSTPLAMSPLGGRSPGVTLTWRDVSVYAVSRGGFWRRSLQHRRIVNGVTGVVRPGTLVAMLGGSGAGKTTLMAALAHRSPAGTLVDGDIRVNGQPVGPGMRRLSGYMHQHELFVGSLTVREHLTLMARLKMDRRTHSSTRDRQLQQLLAQLGLEDRADARIDGALSGGERKRLAFAAELMTDPLLLFCDEPTTGLDSFSAQKLVHMLRQLADQGRTVLCTIHQPSSEVLDLFHEVILLADGRVAFAGELSAALSFFSSQGLECPPRYNPADFVVCAVSGGPGRDDAARRLCDQFAASDAAAQLLADVRLEQLPPGLARSKPCLLVEDTEILGETSEKFKAPFFTTSLLWLTWRYFLHAIRDPTVQNLRILQKIAIAAMAGLCYLGTEVRTQVGVQSVQGALFIVVAENTFSPMYAALAAIPQELPLLRREYRSGLYSPPTYYVARLLAALPGLLVEPVLFVLTAYWLVGLRDSWHAVAMTLLVVTLALNVSTACGCFFGSAFDSVSTAMAYLVPFDYVLMIMSGLFVNLSTLPVAVEWMQYLSWLMYANEALSVVQWEGVTNITCDGAPEGVPCLRSGREVLDKYNFSADRLSSDLACMAGLWGGFHLLAIVCLWVRVRSN